MAMKPRNQVAVSAASTTAPVSTTHSSSVVAPSAARNDLAVHGRTPAATGTGSNRWAAIKIRGLQALLKRPDAVAARPSGAFVVTQHVQDSPPLPLLRFALSVCATASASTAATMTTASASTTVRMRPSAPSADCIAPVSMSAADRVSLVVATAE